jgi:mono/diheme cytochrome c family protein
MGPNLDLLRPTAAQVAAQVRLGGGGMPSFASRLSSLQITEVAVFVARASRLRPPPAASARVLFRTFCGRCHTFAAAGTSGTRGPNLSEEALTAATVAAKIRSGGDGMPGLTESLSPRQIARIATYVSRNGGHAGD